MPIVTTYFKLLQKFHKFSNFMIDIKTQTICFSCVNSKDTFGWIIFQTLRYVNGNVMIISLQVYFHLTGCIEKFNLRFFHLCFVELCLYGKLTFPILSCINQRSFQFYRPILHLVNNLIIVMFLQISRIPTLIQTRILLPQLSGEQMNTFGVFLFTSS